MYLAPTKIITTYSKYHSVLLWLNSVCWDKTTTSHFVIFLATGVAVCFHNNHWKITLQKDTKYYPSKGEGETTVPLGGITEYRVGRVGKFVFTCWKDRAKEIEHVCLDSMEEHTENIPDKRKFPQPDAARRISHKLHEIIISWNKFYNYAL